MKLSVLGATGRTGIHVVRLALQEGYDVSVLVRNETTARERLGDVRVVAGDARAPRDVVRAVEGADAVISALGPVNGSPPDLLHRAATATVTAVRALPRRRLVRLTGAAVWRPGDTPGLVDRLVVGLMSVATPTQLRDSRAGVAVVTDALDVDWTVVRAPRLTDAPARGRWRAVDRVGGGHGTTLPRADLATVLLNLAVADADLRAKPRGQQLTPQEMM